MNKQYKAIGPLYCKPYLGNNMTINKIVPFTRNSNVLKEVEFVSHPEAIEALMAKFAKSPYPETTNYFGREWSKVDEGPDHVEYACLNSEGYLDTVTFRFEDYPVVNGKEMTEYAEFFEDLVIYSHELEFMKLINRERKDAEKAVAKFVKESLQYFPADELRYCLESRKYDNDVSNAEKNIISRIIDVIK